MDGIKHRELVFFAGKPREGIFQKQKTVKKMECKDPNCFKHGNVKVRGNVFTGTVVSAKADKTITLKRTIAKFIAKYERYKKSTSKIKAHAPLCMNIKEGDTVRIGETRKLSKTKSFTVMEITQKGEGAIFNESD